MTVEIRDQFGARLTTATNRVTLAIGTNPSEGTLDGTKPRAAVNGLATFSGLSLNNPPLYRYLVARRARESVQDRR